MSNFQDGLPDLRGTGRRRRRETPRAPAKVVDYPKLLCPACGRDRVKRNRTEPVEPDGAVKIRWHACHGCGWTFKSIERL